MTSQPRWERVISANFPHNDDYQASSFLGQLHELAKWDEAAFWELDRALRDMPSPPVDAETSWRVFRIFSHLNVLLRDHANSNTGFRILDMDADNFAEWCERIQLTFEGVFSGKMLGNDLFEKTNPLLPDDTASEDLG